MTNANKTLSQNTSPQNLIFADRISAGGDAIPNWRECFPEIVGRSKNLLDVLETVAKVARSDSSVLIYGESGTGKELVASALHRLSWRSNRKFVAINCSAIPENLLESELFGHEKGAFTGAVTRRIGHFESAEGGTLFLDEIGEMPLRLQAKLLRVLQEKQYTAVGGHQVRTANVRIVAATNIDLTKAVAAGQFRLDLFYRLNVLPVTMPALRERRDDIEELTLHFLNLANRLRPETASSYFSERALEQLKNYPWPGNVRELQNLVERMVVLRPGLEIDAGHLPAEVQHFSSAPMPQGQNQASMNSSPLLANTLLKDASAGGVQYPEAHGLLPSQGLDMVSYIEQLENDLITEAMQRTGNNKNQAAKLLGLNRTTLVERIKKRQLRFDDLGQK